MTKRDALKQLFICADKYAQNLEGNNILFVFGKANQVLSIETVFLPQNFLHLTGIKIATDKIVSANDFYNHCIDHRLSTDDFEMLSNGISEIKLSVLPQLMSIEKISKQIGDFSNNKPLLITEKLIGNITACMGFVHRGKYYVPNTILKEDIRDITKIPQQRILAVFKKAISDTQYSQVCYLAKGISLDTLTLPSSISNLLNIGSHLCERNLKAPLITEQFSTNTTQRNKPSIHDRIEAAKADIAQRAAEQPAAARPTHDTKPRR